MEIVIIFTSSDTVRTIKQRKMIWAGRTVYMAELRYDTKFDWETQRSEVHLGDLGIHGG
jgi:hypothetical protein